MALFGVELSPDRVVVDGTRITGGGVTSGLDFAFTMLEVLRGADAAKSLQLMLEYDPAPPFQSGHPRVATPELVDRVRLSAQQMLSQRLEVSTRAAKRLESQ